MYNCATRPVSNCVGVVLPSGALGAMRSATITVIYGNHKCCPNSNYLLTQSQVRYMTICSNLPIQKALACTYFTHAWADRHEQTVQLFLSFLCSFEAALNNPAIHT